MLVKISLGRAWDWRSIKTDPGRGHIIMNDDDMKRAAQDYS